MSRLSRLFLTCLFSASTLFAGLVASTHSNCSGGSTSKFPTELATCACQVHLPADQESGTPMPEDHDQNACLVCRLIAEFHAEIPMTIELEFDSMISCFVAVKAATVSLQRFSLFQSRGPPAA